MLLQSIPEQTDSLTNVVTAADTTVVADSTTNIIDLAQTVSTLKTMPVDQVIELLTKSIVEIGLKLLVALLIIVVGKWAIRHIKKVIMAIMVRRNVDTSLRAFVSSLVGMVLMTLLIITTISILGIDTTSFVAVFASASLAIGMALSGTLQNFAGGVMILLLKPFKIGDFIEAQGQSGTVKEIQLFNTTINTLDNKAIIIPNGNLSTGIVNNYSHEEYRRVDWIFGIAYGDNYDTAKDLIKQMLDEDARVFDSKEYPYLIALHELGSSSVDIIVRAWVKSGDYLSVKYDMNEKVYKTFDKHGLNIPFPQMDVHVHNTK
ncbi:MAG: mechanosensitive ion channel [Rikenellaceae bacterium]